jgi:hypothetical protein
VGLVGSSVEAAAGRPEDPIYEVKRAAERVVGSHRDIGTTFDG